MVNDESLIHTVPLCIVTEQTTHDFIRRHCKLVECCLSHTIKETQSDMYHALLITIRNNSHRSQELAVSMNKNEHSWHQFKAQNVRINMICLILNILTIKSNDNTRN